MLIGFFSQETFLVTYFKETSFESFADTPSLIEGCNEIAFDKNLRKYMYSFICEYVHAWLNMYLPSQ